MTDEEINIKIAEALGRVRRPDGFWYPAGKTIGTAGIPNFCNDLNAMHEAESRFDGECVDLQSLWIDNVALSVEWPETKNAAELRFSLDYLTQRLSARQRAEAFLRTLNLWTE